ncbi:hypothetical protein [Mesoterricola silvestris]|uniref:Uncharacterized protein n=1 Tax=Mesoterricola silvestris TaxID=2927979 RepID=A0AA48GRL1_9BACT|nr:hypothetical protein [Mesoterricola silvestris]BDU72945.1 hypothetical protein METEAL_21190 [Mesoterricola silvestris]
MLNDVTSETIQKILDISTPKTYNLKDVHGTETVFSTEALHQVLAAAPPQPKLVAVNTLAGFSELIRAKLENKAFSTEFLIHVESETTVTLKAKETDEYGRRVVLIQAQPVSFDKFKFGQWIDQESFSIAIASLFAESEDKDYVLNLASSITNEATSTSDDNGFTQKATIKAGLSHKAQVTIKPRVALAPFRTFPEVAQPVSEFVFRARITDNGPALMLIEADGGRWKVDAMKTIREAMEGFGLEIPVIA